MDTVTHSELPRNPFPGIEAFGPEYQTLFFGRDRDVELLVRRITMFRGMLLYGAQGVGKSSTLNAGVVARAKRDGFAPWRVGVRPVVGAELVIDQNPARPGSDESGEAQPIARRTTSAATALRSQVEAEAGTSGRRVLLMFDQFEEWVTLFEYPEDEDQRAEFAHAQNNIRDAIVDLIRSEDVPVKVLLAFREDYLANLNPIFGLVPSLPEQFIRLLPLPASDLQDVICGPFDRYPDRYRPPFTRDLANVIIDDLEARSPSRDVRTAELQIVCHGLYEATPAEVEGEADPGDVYNERGCAAGLLRQYFDTAADAVDETLRDPAIELLTRLVSPAGTRNVVSRDDLLSRVELETEIERPLLEQALASLDRDAKLVKVQRREDVDYCEIASEFLIDWIKAQQRARQLRVETQALSDRADEQERKAQAAARRAWWAIAAFVLLAVVLGGLIVNAIFFSGKEGTAELEIGEPRMDSLADEGESAELRFEGTEGQAVSLLLNSDFDATLAIRAPVSGDTISARTTDERGGAVGFAEVLPRTGEYTVVVTRFQEAGDENGYTLASEWLETDCDRPELDGDCAIVVTPGMEPLRGSIETATDFDYFVLEGKEGDLVTLTMDADEDNFDGVMKLYDTSGVATDDTQLDPRYPGPEGGSDVIAALLPEDASYPLWLRGGFNSDLGRRTIGNYTLRVQPTNVVEIGSATTGTLTSDAASAAFTFDGVADDAVALTVSTEDGSEARIEVLDADDANVEEFDGSRTVVARLADVPYRVLVSGPPAGPVTLTVERTEDAAPSEAKGVFAFDGSAGDPVVIVVDVPGAGAATVELLDPASSRIQRIEVPRGRPRSLTQILPETGSYRLVVSDITGSPTEYTVELERPTRTDLERLELGVPTEGTAISQPGGAEVLWFEGDPGDAVTIEINSGDDLDSVVEVYTASGHQLGASDFGGGPGQPEFITTVLPDDGPFWVVTRGDRGLTGDYELVVSATEALDDLEAGDNRAGRVGRTEDHAYPFDAAAGDTVLLVLEPVSLDGVLEVFGPNGDLLAAVNSEGEGETETAVVAIADDGRHWVVVRGFRSSEGSYGLLFDRGDTVPVDVGSPGTGRFADPAS